MPADIKYDGPRVVRLPALPDLRLEQFFLATVRYYCRVNGAEMPQAPLVAPGQHVVTHTDWAAVTAVDWRAVVASLINEQLISPFWQGIFWGIAGAAFATARQSVELARAAHAAAAAARRLPRKEQSTLARLLSRIFVY